MTFAQSRNTVEATFYADPELTMPLFIYTSEGPYSLVAPLEWQEGAWEVELTNDTQTLTLLADIPDLLVAVGWDDCSLVVNEAVDVTNGCAAPPLPPADCVEQDAWNITEKNGADYLQWGDTSIDRCVEAPMSFDPVGLVRVSS